MSGVRAASIRLAFLIVISSLTPALPLDGAEVGRDAPRTVLGQGWEWLKDNKDQISALASFFGALSLVVAARAYYRTQKLNQANAVYNAMKEARDLRLKQYPLEERQIRSDPRWVGVHFYASIDQYRVLGLIDSETWKNFENEIEGLLRDPEIRNWLANRAGGPNGFPPVTELDQRFVDYLRGIGMRIR